MTELIVALDGGIANSRTTFKRLWKYVKWFKVGPGMLLDHEGMGLVREMLREDYVSLFLDLKVYDTRDTVYNIARAAFDLGARFITVHAMPSMLEAAMRAKVDEEYNKVLAVGPLTDRVPWSEMTNVWPVGFNPTQCDGIIRSAECGSVWKANAPDKLLVCPGIRPAEVGPDNHIGPSTPTGAKVAGADYIVVGRPIYNSTNLLTTVVSILEELEA